MVIADPLRHELVIGQRQPSMTSSRNCSVKRAQSSREFGQIVATSSLRIGQFVCTWPKDKVMNNK